MKYDFTKLPTASSNPGRCLFLLGQSSDGPVNAPIPIQSMGDAKRYFGNGNLLESYRQVVDIPGITVYLMRISGEYARLSLLGERTYEEYVNGEATFEKRPGPVITFRSVNAGSIYNDMRIYTAEIERNGQQVKALIIEPPSLNSVGVSYVLSDYQNINELIYAINQDTKLNRNWVFATSNVPFAKLEIMGDLNDRVENMSGGEDGLDLSKDDLYIALETSYSILEGRQVDVICPFGVRLDDTHPRFYYGKETYPHAMYSKNEDFLGLIDQETGRHVSFHEQLIDFCRIQEQFGIMTHGVLGLREVAVTDSLQSYYLSRVLRSSAFRSRDGMVEFRNGDWYDKGYYLSVVAQDYLFDGQVANGCAMYAGMIASLDATQTTSNQAIPDNIELAFELEPEELKDLAYIGAVGARRSVKKGIVITNGVTAGLSGSPLSGIQNIRMLQFTLHILNQVLEGSIGEAFVPAVTLKSLDQQVGEALEYCVSLRIIKAFDYQVRFVSRDVGVIVDLSLQGRNTTEFVDARASLRFHAGGEAV